MDSLFWCRIRELLKISGPFTRNDGLIIMSLRLVTLHEGEAMALSYSSTDLGGALS